MSKKAIAGLLACAAAAAGTPPETGSPAAAQTSTPYIWGISNQGETCGGYCYGGSNGGQYLCCGISHPIR